MTLRLHCTEFEPRISKNSLRVHVSKLCNYFY